MTDLGQLLRKARTQKGLTLDDIQEMTKIRKRYLEAIEEGNYKVLPGNFYVRAFIKSYAEAVGLEPDEVLRLYRNVLPPAETEPVIEKPVLRRRKSSKNTEKLSKWAAALLAIAFPLLIVGIVYYYYSQNAEGRSPLSAPPPLTDSNVLPDGQEQTGPQSQENEPQPVPEPEPEPPRPVLTLEKTEGSVDYYRVTGADQLVVEVTVVGDRCWMAVQKNDSKGEFVEANLTLKNGESRTWTFDGSAYFNFGKANAIRVKVNDQEINLGELANPRRLQIYFEPNASSPSV